jgi:hypothetical protein
MNALEKRRDADLNAIGRELDALHHSRRLDFDSFKLLFLRGLSVCGADTDDLEMFQSVIQDDSWRDWMLEELRKHPQRRVA